MIKKRLRFAPVIRERENKWTARIKGFRYNENIYRILIFIVQKKKSHSFFYRFVKLELKSIYYVLPFNTNNWAWQLTKLLNTIRKHTRLIVTNDKNLFI